MASRNIRDLKENFASKIYKLEENCKNKGVDILFYCTYRDPYEQAELFRQGRSYQEIKDKKEQLITMGYDFIAGIIEEVGPQYEDVIVTNAAPYESWHQYREAVDGVPVVKGKAMWNNTKLYDIYGEEATKLGLYWAGNWKNFKETPHVQLRNVGNPLRFFTIQQVKNAWNGC